MKLIGLILAVFMVVPSAMRAAAPSPNVLMIMIDDLGWRDASCYGSTFYQTVNIDRLAKEGARFTQAYSAHPRCSGARYGIFAGKTPARVAADEVEFPSSDLSLGEVFQQAGYTTFYTGKWFLGADASAPEKHGFSRTVGASNASGPKSYFAPYDKQRVKHLPKKPPITGLEAPKDEYLPDRLTDETIKFIRENRSKRFFAVLSHYAVFAPMEAKPNYVERYRKKLDENPATGREWEAERAGMNKLRQDDPSYAGMIHSVDEGIGRILDLLNEFKIADRTLIILCSDSGGLSCKGTNGEAFTSNRPLRTGKGWLYEGGIRVPLIVKWPGVTKGDTKVDSPVMLTDLYPTLLEMTGIRARPEQHVDGKSFVCLLKKPGSKLDGPERCFFWHNATPRPLITGDAACSAVRCGQYKLLDFYAKGHTELYDLSADLEERNNLIEKLVPKAQELKAKLDAWRNEVNAPMLTGLEAKTKTQKMNK